MRTRSVTLDASCVGKLFLQEPESQEFRDWYRQMRAAGADFQSSSLLQFELGNILCREFKDDPRKGAILVAALDGIELQDIPPSEPFKFTHSLTYYDAAYVAASERSEGLATYDGDMAQAAGRSGTGIVVWDGKRIKAATTPGFVAWLKGLKTTRQPLRGFVEADVRADKFAQDPWSFLQFWGYLQEYRKIEGLAAVALDEAFAEFAARKA